MKRWKGCMLALLLGLIVALSNVQPAHAAPGGNAEKYTYTVTIYSGKQSTFTSGSGISVDNHSTGSSYQISGGAGSDRIKITGLEYGDVVIMDAQSSVQLGGDSKYYVGGVRESGRDNNTVSASAFRVNSDRDYVVAYAIKGNMVSYTVNYVDEAGTPLLPSQTYYGAVGDRPVVAFRYIENYLPLTYNLTKTLSADASQNVFTFVYEYAEGRNYQNVIVLNNDGDEIVEYEESDGDGSDGSDVTTIIEENAGVDGNGDGADGEGEGDPLDLVDLDDEDVPLAYQIAQKIAEFVGDNMLACISGSIFAVIGVCVLLLYLKKRKNKQEEDDSEEEEKEEN